MKYFLTAVFAMVLASSMAFAQGGQGGFASQATTVTADVIGALAIDIYEGAWGEMTPGQCYTTTADGFINPGHPSDLSNTIDQPPGFSFTGNPSDYVEVQLSLPADMICDPQGRLSLSDWTYGYGYGGDFTAGFNGGGPVTGPITILLALDGTADLYLGAKVCVPVGMGEATCVANILCEAHYVVQP